MSMASRRIAWTAIPESELGWADGWIGNSLCWIDNNSLCWSDNSVCWSDNSLFWSATAPVLSHSMLCSTQ